MWGTFMERAKDLAVNLDKQINESVGLETDATASTHNQNGSSEQDLTSGNAWNDDFDFDADEEQVQQQQEPAKQPTGINDDGVVHDEDKTGTQASESTLDNTTAPEVPVAATEDPTPVATAMAHQEQHQQLETLDLVEPDPSIVPEQQVVHEYDDNHNDADADAGAGGHFEEHPSILPVVPKQDESPSLPEPVPVQDPSPTVPPEPIPAATKPRSVFASSMLSSLAQKAEVIAHQAESLVHLPTQLKEPTKVTAAVGISSLLSAFPIASTDTTTAPADAGDWAEDLNDNLDFDEDEESPKTDGTPSVEKTIVDDQPSKSGPEVPVELSAAPTLLEQSDFVAGTNLSHPSSPKHSSDATTGGPIIAIEDDPRYQQLLRQLQLREEQLTNKSNQLTQLQDLMEQQEREMTKKINETKEEAKKRIMRAKERCEAAEAKIQQLQSTTSADSASQAQIIQALRDEGQKLAQKQSAMEQAVRAAKGECRDLAEQLALETQSKLDALAKIATLESDLKTTKEFLSAARKGESQASKLEQDLLAARSDAELKAANILSLQQQIKELNAASKELQDELKRTRKEAQQAAQQEKKTLRQEHHDMINDLENKLRTTEREAGVREDALRHEVSELRKRWQDAVRRADALSMDIQSSTAPLLRQLESMERQNRARAANWAELESRLRSELEETVIQNETLSKERNEFKTKYTRMERLMNEQEQELKQAKRIIEEKSARITKVEALLEEMEAQAQKREEEYSKVERLANEGVMRVRSEMTQTVVDSEERYRSQVDKLEKELRVEHEKRSQLEKQVEQLLENAGMIIAPQATETLRLESKPKKLRKAEGQAEILAGALGFGSDTDDDDDDDDEGMEGVGRGLDRGDASGNGMNSFAALEQLTSRLKAAKIELEALRVNLRESERVREALLEELGESRIAKEKLPLFEAKVKELTEDNREKELEIQGLREDIADVREMYRTQLNLLLEEKAARGTPEINGNENISSGAKVGAEALEASDGQ